MTILHLFISIVIVLCGINTYFNFFACTFIASLSIDHLNVFVFLFLSTVLLTVETLQLCCILSCVIQIAWNSSDLFKLSIHLVVCCICIQRSCALFLPSRSALKSLNQLPYYILPVSDHCFTRTIGACHHKSFHPTTLSHS